MDVGHTVAVVNRPLPPWVDLDPASAAAKPAGARLMAASLPTSRSLGRTTSRPATVDAGTQTLSTSALASGSSTTVSFDTVAPVATFGAPDVAEVNLSSGALTLDYPLALPAGPGGLTPPLRLGYDSASVSDQHNVAAAAPWVGEGWRLSLGGISWAERDIAAGCTSTSPCPTRFSIDRPVRLLASGRAWPVPSRPMARGDGRSVHLLDARRADAGLRGLLHPLAGHVPQQLCRADRRLWPDGTSDGQPFACVEAPWPRA